MCELKIRQFSFSWCNADKIDMWHGEKVMQLKYCRKRTYQQTCIPKVPLWTLEDCYKIVRLPVNLEWWIVHSKTPVSWNLPAITESVQCVVYTVIHDPAQSHFNSFQLLFQEDRSAITRIAKRTWTSNARKTMPNGAFPLRLLQLWTTFSTHCAHDPITGSQFRLLSKDQLRYPVKELSFQLNGGFIRSWSPRICHWFFNIQKLIISFHLRCPLRV